MHGAAAEQGAQGGVNGRGIRPCHLLEAAVTLLGLLNLTGVPLFITWRRQQSARGGWSNITHFGRIGQCASMGGASPTTMGRGPNQVGALQ